MNDYKGEDLRVKKKKIGFDVTEKERGDLNQR